MKPDGNELSELIRYRLGEAKETVDDVQLLIDNERYRAAVNRIYYGMFYSLLALGLAYKFETSKHQQLLGWFNKNFVHEGLIDPKFGIIIKKASIRRTVSDYESNVEYDKEVILQMFDEQKEFIFEIERFLNKK
jgi:uncharacterized protein (UPF0332 family)